MVPEGTSVPHWDQVRPYRGCNLIRMGYHESTIATRETVIQRSSVARRESGKAGAVRDTCPGGTQPRTAPHSPQFTNGGSLAPRKRRRSFVSLGSQS